MAESKVGKVEEKVDSLDSALDETRQTISKVSGEQNKLLTLISQLRADVDILKVEVKSLKESKKTSYDNSIKQYR